MSTDSTRCRVGRNFDSVVVKVHRPKLYLNCVPAGMRTDVMSCFHILKAFVGCIDASKPTQAPAGGEIAGDAEPKWRTWSYLMQLAAGPS